jgi:predicted DCC family thiol-disulfide oxidoreductase YuxK
VRSPGTQPLPDPVVVFDGMCNLCSRAVRFILRRDRRGAFRFAALQSEAGARLLLRHGIDPATVDSLLLVLDGTPLRKSDAILGIAGSLGAPWSFLALFRVLPKRMRDGLYDVMARNRTAWFGRSDRCSLPDAGDRARFLT